MKIKYCFLTLLLSVSISGCETKKEVADQTPPVLENLGVAFGPLDASIVGMAGDFDFKYTDIDSPSVKNCDRAEKLFLEFGAEVSGKLLPTFEYRVIETAEVVSPITGVVTAVQAQSAGDYAIFISPSSNSAWTLEIDHVHDVTVSSGSTVVAGQVLGSPGEWSTLGQGRVEIMLYNGGTAYCPFNYFDPETKASFIAAVETHMDEWESAICKNTTVWDRSAMSTIGCVCNSMSTASDVSSCID